MTRRPQDPLDEVAKIWRQDPGPLTSDFTRARLKSARSQALVALAERLVALAGLGFGAWLALTGSTIAAGACLVFSTFALTASLWARRSASRVATGAVLTELDRSILHEQIRCRAAWSSLFVCAAALLFLAAIAWTRPDPPNHLLVLALAWIAAGAAAAILGVQRARRRLSRLHDVRHALQIPDEE